MTQVRPLLLAAFKNFSPKEFSLLLDACISWTVRTLLSGISSGGALENYYSRNALKITNGDVKKAGQVKNDLAEVVPNDAKFKAALVTANASNQHLARYYLRAMQRCQDGEPEPQYIPNPGSEITLEHILPEKAREGWEHISEDDRKKYLNRLGNQVLLTGTVNSKLGNVRYSVKKVALQASQYSLTSETGNFNTWGPSEIEERQKQLAELAIKTWPL